MCAHFQRQLQLEGARNLRDIGGYATNEGRRTRWRVVLRSGRMDRLTPAAQSWLTGIGLKTVIDLRDDTEVAEAPNVFADSDQVRYRRVPVFDTPLPVVIPPPSLEEGYRRMLFQRQARIRAVFEQLLEPRALPAVIHCAVGKDRTGVVIALLLAALGVSTETIVDDYALSGGLNETSEAEARRFVERQGWSWELTATQWACPPQLMRKTLEEVQRRCGSVPDYLTSAGLELRQLERLRTLICS